MSDCCSSSGCSPIHPNKHICPANGREYAEVLAKTINHHISEPWSWDDQNESYYFCDDPECEVIYFSASNKTITQDRLRTVVGQKTNSASALLCYCFGVSRETFETNPRTKNYVIAQTKNKTCACDIRNPSGRCCLKDFPRNEN